jgi:hypothetical protein
MPAGRLWAVGKHEIFQVKAGPVVFHFALEGQLSTGQSKRVIDVSVMAHYRAGPTARS